jgi:hypothetical protein
MQGIREEILGPGVLDDLTQIHDSRPVRHIADCEQIVSNQQEAHVVDTL